MQLSSASFAYPRITSTIRADLAARMLRAPLPRDVFALSTCLRLEVAVPGDRNALSQVLASIMGDASVLQHATVRSDYSATEHLFRVAAGLESPIVGELEILTQFRQNLIASEDQDRVGGLFAKLLETAVSVGRQARKLLPRTPHDSMGAVAALTVSAETKVAVLGSGLMATSVVTNLKGLSTPPDITVVARNPQKVTLKGVDVWPFERAAKALATFPAVVSATSAKARPIPDQKLAEVLRERSTPLTLVDMAMPPDFRPPPGAPVRYLDIDDLARMTEQTAGLDAAAAMVAAAAAEAYWSIAEHHHVGPVIEQLMRSSDDVVDQIVGQFAGKLRNDGDLGVLRQAVHTVARTLLASPVAYLRSSDRSPGAIDTIADAFDLKVENG